MSRRSRLNLMSILIALALSCGLLTATTATADVTYSQQIVMVGDRPVSGRFVSAFTSYGEPYNVCITSKAGGYCTFKGYRVARGHLETKLTTFRVKEGVDDYDYYLLDVDTLVNNHTGSSKLGSATVVVGVGGPRIVDQTVTKTIRATEADCAKLQLSLSTPWPVISAATEVGHVNFCDKNAAFVRSASGTTNTYVASRLGKINKLTVNSAVKVPAGKHPTFNVAITVPTDTCTASKDGWCTKYENGTLRRSYSVGTTG